MIWAIASTLIFLALSVAVLIGAQSERPGCLFYGAFIWWIFMAVACGDAWEKMGA